MTSTTDRYRSPARPAFTLVELMVVITVMVTLAGMLTYALASAQTDARIKRTEADVLTIGQLLQTRMNEIALSRVNLLYGANVAIAGPLGGPATPTNPPLNGNQLQAAYQNFAAAEQARLILLARRDLMRMALPECRADLLYPPASLQFRTRVTSNTWRPNVAQVKAPAEWNKMRILAGLYSADTLDARIAGFNPVNDPAVDGIAAAYNSGAWQEPFNRFALDYNSPSGATGPDYIDDSGAYPAAAGDPDDKFWSRENESAECLYLILATTELNGKRAIDQIQSTRIGDTDGDGFLEVLDAWGEPYLFLRNPISLDSPAIKNHFPTEPTSIEQFPIDPDATDLLSVDFRNYTNYRSASAPAPLTALPGDNAYFPVYLPPAVISSGRDREFGLHTSYVDTDEDGMGDLGTTTYYSSSVVQLPYGGANEYQPVYINAAGQTLIPRYPDPFFNVMINPIGSTNLHRLSPEGIVFAKMGDAFYANGQSVGGLGTTINEDTAADNITSLDAGF